MDEIIQSKEKKGGKAIFAKVYVAMDFTEPPLEEILFQLPEVNRRQKFIYESIPVKCEVCNRLFLSLRTCRNCLSRSGEASKVDYPQGQPGYVNPVSGHSRMPPIIRNYSHSSILRVNLPCMMRETHMLGRWLKQKHKNGYEMLVVKQFPIRTIFGESQVLIQLDFHQLSTLFYFYLWKNPTVLTLKLRISVLKILVP